MIETPDFKIAQNTEEAFWIEFKKARLENIKASQRNIVIDEELVKLAEQKISEAKNGE